MNESESHREKSAHKPLSILEKEIATKIESVSVITGDGVPLSLLVISPVSTPKAVVQMHAGTVIRKEFYLKFSKYLAAQGYVIILFDYRGVGASRPKSLKNYKASISDWGRRDAPVVLDWIKGRYSNLPIHLFAHSMGGQILGLMYNWNDFDKITVVASSSGNWNNFLPAYRRKVKWSSNLLFPLYFKLFGYVPGRFGLGLDWPRGVAEEWWQNSRQNGRIADLMQSKHKDTYFQKINKKITAYFIEDDHMASATTIPNYQLSFPNANVDTRVLVPTDYDLESIGHFGLYKLRTKGRLWEEVIGSLD